MDEFNIDKAFVQARPGSVTNDQVALSIKKYPERLFGLMRIGHDQEAAYEYLEDPAPVGDSAPEQIAYCIEELGMIGLGEIFIRAMTAQVDPEKITKRPCSNDGCCKPIKSTYSIPYCLVTISWWTFLRPPRMSR